jgi:hypothetical protein
MPPEAGRTWRFSCLFLTAALNPGLQSVHLPIGAFYTLCRVPDLFLVSLPADLARSAGWIFAIDGRLEKRSLQLTLCHR